MITLRTREFPISGGSGGVELRNVRRAGLQLMPRSVDWLENGQVIRELKQYL
jgi:hypothetical protein